jgi:thiol-disulfide isomerase/thioredoxin/tetratricopeptide (TPR) repeat protein
MAGFIKPLAAQETLYPCSTPLNILEAFQKLDFPNDMAMTAQERDAKTKEIFDSLFAKYPDNFFVQRRYEDYRHNNALRAGTDVAPLIKEYHDLMVKHPDDPRYLYFYARIIYDTQPEEAIRYHEKALELAPNFPWPHLQLATIYAYGKRDLAKRQAQLEAFMKMCPSSMDYYKYFYSMEDKDFLRQSAQHLRTLLDGRTDSEALEAYDWLWTIEYRGSTPSDYAQVRERQAADLSRLRALNLESNLQWYKTLNEGYKTQGDTQGQKWVEDQLMQHLPQSGYTSMLVFQSWLQEHPWPGEDASTEVRNDFYRAMLKTTAEWVHLWPQSLTPWSFRLQAVTHLKDVSDSDAMAAIDGYMAMMKKDSSVIQPASMSLLIAKVYVERGIRLESVPQLVADGVEETQKRIQQSASYAGMPPDYREMQSTYLNSVRWEGWSILAEDYIKSHQPVLARETLVKMGKALSANKPAESAKPQVKDTYSSQSRDYWEKMAMLAEAQNHKADALGYYLNALDSPPRLYPESDKQEETVAKARQLWEALGGTDEGWSVWTTQHMPANPEAGAYSWTKLDKPVPDFSLPDLSGRTWRLQDLKGKVTFVNVWATWCGPCQAEMPFVQKLVDQLKDKPDVQVVTFNIDENPGLIDPYLRDSHYTFPIIPATSLFVQIDQFMAIPRNWIVDANGVLRREQLGFGSKNSDWLQSATKVMNEVRAGQ